MPSEQFRLKTVEALRRSRKGQLPYRRESGEEILEEGRGSLQLSPYSEWVLEKILSHSPKPTPLFASPQSDDSAPAHGLSFTALDTPPTNQLVSTPRSTEAPSEIQEDEEWRGHPPEVSAVPPLSKATAVEGLIRLHEKIQALKAKEQLKERLELQELVVKAASEESRELLKRFDELKALKRHQECQHLQQELENSSREAQGQQEKLKEEHRRRAKLLNRKLREAEQQRQRQEELDRHRREEGQQRLQRLYSIQEEVLRVHQQIGLHARHKDLPGMDLSLYSNRANQICGEVSGIVRQANEVKGLAETLTGLLLFLNTGTV